MRVLGLDPGLRRTGWGVIESAGTRLTPIANGVVTTDDSRDTPVRLAALYEALGEVLAAHAPDAAAVEESLANKNAQTSLKLGVARGVVLLVPAQAGLPVTQYLPMIVKKAVVGTGHAAKQQIAPMVQRLLPGCRVDNEDAADALAVAICHAHHAGTRSSWADVAEQRGREG